MTGNRNLLEALGINISRIRESGKTLCPKCSHERTNKNDPCLSVDVTKGLFRCHHCEFKGYVGEKGEYESKRVYAKPVFNNRTELSENMVNWFFKRSISQQTLIDLKVTESVEYFPQVQSNRNAINFNYFRAGELINVKYRDGSKNFKMFKDAELIMYNIDSIVDSEECAIVEGELDCMAFHEVGYTPVTSVPNGASKGQKLEYLDNCISYFEDKKKIYIAVDTDSAGIELRNELVRRLGSERCFLVDYKDFKDANDLLVAEGKESLLERLKLAKEVPVSGIFNINDFRDRIEYFWEYGLPEGEKSGDAELDAKIRLMLGEMTVITGIPSHGKSGFLEQWAIKLAHSAGWRFGVFSPESYPAEIYYQRMMKKLIGRPISKHNISREELDNGMDFYSETFSFIKPDKDFSIDSILEKALVLVKRRGINALIIDPWNRIDGASDATGGGQVVVEIISKILRFAQLHNIHVFLVAHPRKMSKADPKDPNNPSYCVPTLYDISGSAHFFNMTQNGITIYRNFEMGTTEVYIQKIKWEHLGEQGMVQYVFDPINTRFYHEGQDSSKNWTKGVDVPLKQEGESPFNDAPVVDDPSAGISANYLF